MSATAVERVRIFCLGLTLLWFIGGGLAHLIGATDFFVRITPPWVPYPRAVIYLSGAVELLLAAALFNLRLRPLAGWGLIAVIFAVTPANIHMWQHAERFPEAPRWFYAARLVLQLGLVWAVWFGTRLPVQRSSPST